MVIFHGYVKLPEGKPTEISCGMPRNSAKILRRLCSASGQGESQLNFETLLQVHFLAIFRCQL